MAKVLVVDADVVLLSLVTDVLEKADHTVWKARSDSEGLRLLRGTDRFDLLIADVALDGGSGVKLIQKARTELPNLPVMVLSGFLGNESGPLRQSLRRLGVAQVLRKPFPAHVFEQAVSTALGERR